VNSATSTSDAFVPSSPPRVLSYVLRVVPCSEALLGLACKAHFMHAGADRKLEGQVEEKTTQESVEKKNFTHLTCLTAAERWRFAQEIDLKYNRGMCACPSSSPCSLASR